ncbi:MAG: acyl-CoA dehydrogenase family protein [Alphaproteobacteria bacterium]|nr:acyl-CoA dehydrogenase family protein [Alphaproteobacteria bacterium]MCB9696489.1 acyl-CoA dehydrogenase family protein [Alphaproteobacteria bacterium]
MNVHTHEVLNQAPPLPDFDAYATDLPLVETVARWGGSWAADQLSTLGRVAGSAEGAQLAVDANVNRPVLRAHDRYGHRVDQVDFHPAYHELMRIGKAHQVHSLSWNNPGRPGAFVARSALHYLYGQLEAGVACPITMTHAVVPSLRETPEVAALWEPGILSDAYDPTFAPPSKKRGLTFGMAMTEKQGGSDVRANTTVAVPDGEGFRLTGHKWFCSAPMCDAFLTLAQGPGGLTCYLVPRWLPDDTPNTFLVQRLKDKLGNHSNASSEIEYRDTWGVQVGPPGKGVKTILAMVAQTRVDVATAASGLMRQALRYATHHARHRKAFGRLLIDQPLMRNVLADMEVEVEASVLLSFRVASALDRGATDPGEEAFGRAAMAIAKYWISKRVIGLTAEALECHGGNGYAENWPMARLYREAPLGSVWEGSGNVQCLDVLRAMERSPASMAAVQKELEGFRGKDTRLDRLLGEIRSELSEPATLELRARRLVEKLALALQGGLMLEHAPAPVAEAWLAGRLGGGGYEYGTLPAGVDLDAILARA